MSLWEIIAPLMLSLQHESSLIRFDVPRSVQAVALAIPLVAGSIVSATTADNVAVWYVSPPTA